MTYSKIHLHSSDTLSLSVVSHADYWTFRHCILTALNISATQMVADMVSRCSSALRFWFLLLPAAQHRWWVSPCTLDTNTLGRQPICNRCRREASCQFLATDTSHLLILHVGAVGRQMFKCQWQLCGCLLYTTCYILLQQFAAPL